MGLQAENNRGDGGGGGGGGISQLFHNRMEGEAEEGGGAANLEKQCGLLIGAKAADRPGGGSTRLCQRDRFTLSLSNLSRRQAFARETERERASFPVDNKSSATMAVPRSLLQYVCSLVLFAACSHALKFDLGATHGQERCIRNLVAKDTLVVVTATVSGAVGDGMSVNMNVSLPSSHARPP